MTWTEWLKTVVLRKLASLSDRAKALLAVTLIVLGLALGFASLVPEIRPAGMQSLGGTLPPFSELNEPLAPATALSEVRLVNGSCAVFLTVLDEPQLQEFNTTGNRPTPQLDCDHRVATFDAALVWVILENRAGTNESYRVEARFLSVRSPSAYLAIVGFPLVLGGAMYLVVRGLRRGVEQIREEIRDKSKIKNKKM